MKFHNFLRLDFQVMSELSCEAQKTRGNLRDEQRDSNVQFQ